MCSVGFESWIPRDAVPFIVVQMIVKFSKHFPECTFDFDYLHTLMVQEVRYPSLRMALVRELPSRIFVVDVTILLHQCIVFPINLIA